MSAKNKARGQVAFVVLTMGVLLLLISLFADTGLRFFLFPLGGMLLAASAVMLMSLSIINGVPWFVRLMSIEAEPVWDGEILYANGGEHKIRYLFDDDGVAHFVADDVCVASGTNPPLKSAQKWGGAQLLTHGENRFFSESSVQDYLMPLAHKNYDANRLLVHIRNNVLRRLDRQRGEVKRSG